MTHETAAAEVAPKPRISVIWLLPAIALIIGLGMVYDSWQNRGISIQILFDTAEGLEVDKTKVKYRNVDVGLVKNIGFNEDKSSIVIDVVMEQSFKDFLSEDSRFWVVKPRIGAEGISGVGTLLSGAYIEIAPGQSQQSAQRFIGLETPPVTPPNADGLHVTLTSQGGTPLYVGNPVIHRGFDVGKVESFEFLPDSREARYQLFIRAPYHQLVTSNTFFWNVGGFSLNADAEGIRLDVSSLESLVSGGVEFDVPADLPIGHPIQQEQSFALYDSRDSVNKRRQYEYVEYAMLVEDSVGGLYEGAPVEYKGIRVGTVQTPYVKFDDPRHQRIEGDRIAIIVRIEPGRMFDEEQTSLQEFDTKFRSWIHDGLSASIENANLITGSLKVTLDNSDTTIDEIERFGEHSVIPSRRTSLSSMTESLQNILAKLEQLPLDETVSNANKTLGSADVTLNSLNRSIQELETVLQGAQPGSPLYLSAQQSLSELQTTLSELQQTLQSTKPLIQNITNKPNALIFSGAVPADPQPAARRQ